MDNSSLPKSQVRILKAHLIPPLTCPLCNGIFKEATTINECMHTFCKDCIYQKSQAKGIACCPKCNKDLSHLSPEDYLRPDERWRNIVKLYNEGQTPQATPPPSIAATTSKSTAKQLKKNKNKGQKTG
ncbi:hypothetical protein Vadar_016309 [Vaccinium darrowii]|uniref:Uncharacterized protein n=1 Tax=Vaccinium darrowii TaxID=229202 RepID=A0ACB7YEH3_9ERIC|nr:hypothetical protein Vadar_016309 [Vaccinium darrowii]